MCGLTGFWASRPIPDALGLLSHMSSVISHRGPDAHGTWFDTSAGLGLAHRRLSILDLTEAGAQPMHSTCGRYVIVFNGEIYNHLDLRERLAAERVAVTWRGHSDTETLLAAITHFGLDETLKLAVGMFALALWDRSGRCLYLARDRLGEKPLYWGWVGSSLVFGSELKAMRQYPNFPIGVCHDALALYLRFAYVPAPWSIHPGIYKLEPGCILQVHANPPSDPPRYPLRPGESLGSISIRHYWSLNETIASGIQSNFESQSDAIEEIEVTLRKAVKRQMISDVPLGAFLSGGIDSSLIVSLMQGQSSRPVKTFTIGFEKSTFNEAPYAKAVARHLSTEHSEFIVTDKEARDVIQVLPSVYDEPFADSSQIPTYLVSQAARAHVTVSLSGDGGDELFAGYNRYVLGPGLWRRLSLFPEPVRKLIASGVLAVPQNVWDQFGSIYNRIRPSGVGVGSLGYKVHRVAARLGSVTTVDDLYKSMVSQWVDPQRLLADNTKRGEPRSLLDDPLPSVLNGDPLGRMMAQDLRSYLPDDILCKVDRAAMAVSLETRAPFLDPDVVALAMRLPLSMRIKNGQGKWALRQILDRYVPRKLIERPKVGFAIPIGDWLRGPLRPWAEDLLSPHALHADGLIDPVPVQQAWADHLEGRRDWTNQLWIILMFQAWRRAQN